MKEWEKSRLVTAEHTLDQAAELELWRAYGKRHGVSPAVPDKKKREVTAVDKDRINAERGEVTELVWLHVKRDALCVELDLTPDQVAGVLSEATKVRNGTPSRTTQASGGPKGWPVQRVTKAGADPASPPLPGAKEYEAEQIDKDVVLAERKRIPETANKAWSEFVERYGAHRRLTTQQIAGIVAVAKRKRLLTK